VNEVSLHCCFSEFWFSFSHFVAPSSGLLFFSLECFSFKKLLTLGEWLSLAKEKEEGRKQHYSISISA
jgi:hypothetical protein